MTAQKPPVGTKIQTKSGRVGVVVEPPWEMPQHVMVELDTGDRRFVLIGALRQ